MPAPVDYSDSDRVDDLLDAARAAASCHDRHGGAQVACDLWLRADTLLLGLCRKAGTRDGEHLRALVDSCHSTGALIDPENLLIGEARRESLHLADSFLLLPEQAARGSRDQ